MPQSIYGIKMKKLLSILLLFTLVAAKPVGGGNDPLTLITDRKSVACNVEQQTIRLYGTFNPLSPCPSEFVVNNPTGCPWDIDDAWSMVDLSGTISTGQIVTASLCAIADGTHRAPVDAAVYAKHPYLLIKLEGSDGRVWVASPVKTGNNYEYTICGDNFIQKFPHPEVPNSNGGQGTYVTYTLTIDASVRGANGVTALLKYGQGIWSVSACE